MSNRIHPRDALVDTGEAPPILTPCEHYAGSEKLIIKALALQEECGPIFDITCDCEDGAPRGEEQAHAQMVARCISSTANKFDHVGARIHDYGNPAWRSEVDIILGEAGARVAYLTIPKSSSLEKLLEVVDFIEKRCAKVAPQRSPLPLHVLIETHGALRDVWEIAALPQVEVLDFGLLDFIAAHNGAIPRECMYSPGQFDHALLRRARVEISAAAIACNCISANSITLALRDPQLVYNDALRARKELGCQRMWSIHPDQITPIIDAMSPDFGEIALAEAILLKAQDSNWSPMEHQGELYDRASYRFFWGLLQRAAVAGKELSAEAKKRFFS